jgi:hypothetical protein
MSAGVVAMIRQSIWLGQAEQKRMIIGPCPIIDGVAEFLHLQDRRFGATDGRLHDHGLGYFGDDDVVVAKFDYFADRAFNGGYRNVC